VEALFHCKNVKDGDRK